MSVFDEPKVDAHCHVLDPARFAYPADVAYRPAGQEQGGIEQYLQVMDAYGIHHALLVGPNSGYGTDNRCLLDAIARAADLGSTVLVPRSFHTVGDAMARLPASMTKGESDSTD